MTDTEEFVHFEMLPDLSRPNRLQWASEENVVDKEGKTLLERIIVDKQSVLRPPPWGDCLVKVSNEVLWWDKQKNIEVIPATITAHVLDGRVLGGDGTAKILKWMWGTHPHSLEPQLQAHYEDSEGRWIRCIISDFYNDPMPKAKESWWCEFEGSFFRNIEPRPNNEYRDGEIDGLLIVSPITRFDGSHIYSRVFPHSQHKIFVQEVEEVEEEEIQSIVTSQVKHGLKRVPVERTVNSLKDISKIWQPKK